MSALSDRRRNLGPTDLVPVSVVEESRPNSLHTNVRPVFVSQGITANASGSSYYEAGDIKLIAAVHGPRQSRGTFSDQAEIDVNVNIAEFAGVPLQQDVSQAVADFVRSSVTPVIILKEYPKSQIVINLTVLNGEGEATLLAGAVNAVVMALVNAGIALHDMVTAISIGIVSSDAEVYVDSEFDDMDSVKQLVAAYSVSTRKLVSMLVTSETAVSKTDLRTLLDRAGTAATELRSLLNSFILEDYVRERK